MLCCLVHTNINLLSIFSSSLFYFSNANNPARTISPTNTPLNVNSAVFTMNQTQQYNQNVISPPSNASSKRLSADSPSFNSPSFTSPKRESKLITPSASSPVPLSPAAFLPSAKKRNPVQRESESNVYNYNGDNYGGGFGLPPSKIHVVAQNLRGDPFRKAKVKTELCLHYTRGKKCPFGDKCNYAHGEEELKVRRPLLLLFKIVSCLFVITVSISRQ